MRTQLCIVIIQLHFNKKNKMGKDQNDNSNQQPGSKSTQETFEDGTKKKETNPANPTAKQDHKQRSEEGEEKTPVEVPVGKSENQNTKKGNY